MLGVIWKRDVGWDNATLGIKRKCNGLVLKKIKSYAGKKTMFLIFKRKCEFKKSLSTLQNELNNLEIH